MRHVGCFTVGYHAWRTRSPSRYACDDERISEAIRRIFAESRRTYGAPRIHATLARPGIQVGRRRVARLMRHNGLVGRPGCLPGPRTTAPTRRRSAPPDLVKRDFTAEAPNRLWLADITYLRTWEGWLYLSAILDVHSRMIVGWAIATHLRTPLHDTGAARHLRERQAMPSFAGRAIPHRTA